MRALRVGRRRTSAAVAALLALSLTAAACSGTADDADDEPTDTAAPAASDAPATDESTATSDAAPSDSSAAPESSEAPDEEPADEGSEAAYVLTETTPAPSGDIDSITWSLYAEPFSLAYLYAYDYPPNTVLSNVCERLLTLNPDLTIGPGLAESFDNPDPLTWVYTIRQGVTFHDGSTMTADDVVVSLSAHLNPAYGSFWMGVYANVESITKTADDEVTVKLRQPDSLFNQYMATTAGVVESTAFLVQAGADYGNSSTGVNCTGPFQFDSWTPGDNITLTRYDGYWNEDLAAKAGEIKFVFLSDPNTRTNAWVSGEVDGGWTVPSNAIGQLEGSGPGSLYFGINTAVASEIVSNFDGPLGDPKVRQALLMAIDREGLVGVAEQGIGTVATSLVTPSTWFGLSEDEVLAGQADLPTYEYDPEAAKELAAEAGVDGQEIVIATTPAFQAADIIAAAVADAAKEIGLEPRIETVSPDSYTLLFSDPAARAEYDLFMTYWYTSFADPMEYFAVLQTGNFANYGGWSNPDFDAAAAEAIATPLEDPARIDSIRTAEVIAMTELPWLPIYSAPTSVWLGDRISGVSPSINHLYYPWAATLGAK